MSEVKNEKANAPANAPNPSPNAGDKKSKMKTCDSCGKEYAKSAKACPYCGAKNKKPWYKRWWFYVIIAVVVVAIIVAAVAGSSGSSYPDEVSDALAMSESEFKDSCKEYEYRDLIRNSDAYYGEPIKVKVCINQDLGDSTYNAMSQSKDDIDLENEMKAYGESINESDYFSGGQFLLTDYRESDTTPIVENDIVTVYGIYLGTSSVEHVLGDTANVPNIGIIYATIEN